VIKAAYILSAGHSGSTMLNLMLGLHPNASAVSELTDLPKNIAHDEPCTCGKSVRHCPVWSDVFSHTKRSVNMDMLHDPYAFDLGFISDKRAEYRNELNGYYRTLWQLRRITVFASQMTGVKLPAFMSTRFRKANDNRLAVYDAVRATTGCALVVDASKEYLTGLTLYQNRPHETRLILLIRDGRAVFYSNLKRGFGRRYSLRAWLKYYQHALPLLTRNVPSPHRIVVRYEDLASDTESQLRRLCQFLDLEYSASMLDSATKQQHITSGNNMRFNFGAPIRIDDKWRLALGEKDLKYFESHAGHLNRILGYE
jgi:Sulfotransferase family